MNCVSRSIPNHWQIFPLIGKENRCGARIADEVPRFSAAFGNWHASCKDFCEPAHSAPVQQNRKVDTMKTKIAQAATFAFSAVGALAILVGAIDYPATAANAAGLPVVGLVDAASTPAVGPVA
ncbi:MAG: hypothetical protein ACO1NN_11485 [Sphingopyxis sp.]